MSEGYEKYVAYNNIIFDVDIVVCKEDIVESGLQITTPTYVEYPGSVGS